MTDDFSYHSLVDLAAKHRPAPVIRESKFCVEQFRFPRSKKRRIRAKWEKRPVNFRPSRHALFDKEANAIYMHPDMTALMTKSPPVTMETSFS